MKFHFKLPFLDINYWGKIMFVELIDDSAKLFCKTLFLTIFFSETDFSGLSRNNLANLPYLGTAASDLDEEGVVDRLDI